ncbi:DUF2075 domain-containing protein [Oxyplasma meridianum]|uniref:DUF2075 domain-containing protein n=1 Tax=Oxyplasma meridianum TaxID=3073602 RepID=A0AAX4NJ94_9ARCH
MASSLFFTRNFNEVVTREVVDQIKKNFHAEYGILPGKQQVMSWEGSINNLKNIISPGTAVFMELKFPIGLERADYLLMRHGEAKVIEVKGWKKYERVDKYTVRGDSDLHGDPCYQMENYVSKLNNFHSASSTIKFSGAVYMYQTTDGNECKILYNGKELENDLQALPYEPATCNDVMAIENGTFQVGRSLVNFVRCNMKSIMENASQSFLNSGFGLSTEQIFILRDIMKSLMEKDNRIFLISGGMGSGKTLLALNILFSSIEKGYGSLLAYRNNRLINTLRKVVGPKFSPLLVYYSTGAKANFRGLGERNFDQSKLQNVSIIIYDESQRMTRDVIKTCMKRQVTSVFFYDEDQILIGDEEGDRETFEKYAKETGRTVVKYNLDGFYRVNGGRKYEEFIKSIFSGNVSGIPEEYDFRTFDQIKPMLGYLESIKSQRPMGRVPKIALLASFTRSDGRKEKRRIFDPEIDWLMDEKTEYPSYWLGQRDPLKYCASIYGSQGFESDYIGLIWGEDLVWRNGWNIQPDKIMDKIGGGNSLKSLSKTDPKKAMKLLINRYRVMLTRGMKGTTVYFEDSETFRHIECIKNRAAILGQIS